jgi:hypothetical protein
MSARFDELLPLLVRGGVDFILVGGVAKLDHQLHAGCLRHSFEGS